ncbi:hypothetical protein M8542_02510 [Amycolatopsis sp. OK19-0408]|uniref:Uncharacterized protein n=1 Tax=Amycolatopsis iheyensis TaxID=2945988 RepID=A0A9X2NBY2_9PSEU|nr:hypothetical protein [Amycolatopsis iheyensis]MCR6481680.1 hypothetical protein [Amycolatopsis iheyensis]
MPVIREGKGESRQKVWSGTMADLKRTGTEVNRVCQDVSEIIRVPSASVENKLVPPFEVEIELDTETLRGTLDEVFDEADPKRMQAVRFVGRSPAIEATLVELSIEMRGRREDAVELSVKPMNAVTAELIRTRLEGRIKAHKPRWSFMLKPIGWVLFAIYWILLPAGTVSVAFAQSATLLTTATAGTITTVFFSATLVHAHNYIFPQFHLKGNDGFSRVNRIFLEMFPLGISIVSVLFSVLHKG